MRKIIVFTLPLIFISTIGLKTAFAEKIVVVSQDIDDSGPFVSWSRGNSNGLMEPGEHIELTVTLKNDGKDTANNVQGLLTTGDESVNIHDSTVNYNDIPPGWSSPTPLMLFQNLQDLQNPNRYTFKIEVRDDAIAHDITFALTLTASNRTPSVFTITLPIINPSEIRLQLPKDFISEEAFSSRSVYFILKAKHPTLTGIPDARVSYEDCMITLHIPEGTQSFMFPIQTQSEIAKEKGIDLLFHVAISVVSKLIEEEIKGATRGLAIVEFFERAAELLRLREHNLRVRISGILAPGHGHPDTEIEHLVLLKHQTQSVKSIQIAVEQKYRIGNSRKSFTARGRTEWNFAEGWASPVIQQSEVIVGQNYPNPFNPETWIPYELEKPADVTLTFHTVDGQIVRQLALGYQPAGVYHGLIRAAYWDGRNTHGEFVANGVYFYTLKAGKSTVTRKMLIKR